MSSIFMSVWQLNRTFKSECKFERWRITKISPDSYDSYCYIISMSIDCILMFFFRRRWAWWLALDYLESNRNMKLYIYIYILSSSAGPFRWQRTYCDEALGWSSDVTHDDLAHVNPYQVASQSSAVLSSSRNVPHRYSLSTFGVAARSSFVNSTLPFSAFISSSVSYRHIQVVRLVLVTCRALNPGWLDQQTEYPAKRLYFATPWSTCIWTSSLLSLTLWTHTVNSDCFILSHDSDSSWDCRRVIHGTTTNEFDRHDPSARGSHPSRRYFIQLNCEVFRIVPLCVLLTLQVLQCGILRLPQLQLSNSNSRSSTFSLRNRSSQRQPCREIELSLRDLRRCWACSLESVVDVIRVSMRTCLWVSSSFALNSGCRYVNATRSLCPREKFTHVCQYTLCRGQWYNVFRIISHNNSIQHTTIRSALELFVPIWNVLSHGSSLSFMAWPSKTPSFLVSTAAEAVGVIGVCLADSGGNGTFWPRTKHTPTCSLDWTDVVVST